MNRRMSVERQMWLGQGIVCVMIFGGGPNVRGAGFVLMVANFWHLLHRIERGDE